MTLPLPVDPQVADYIKAFSQTIFWAHGNSHTHLEVSHPGQPFSAKPPPHSSSPVRGTKHLSATAKHLELIKQLAPPTEHPPLASKHPETNTTSLTLEVNKLEENKGSQWGVIFKGNKQVPKKGVWDEGGKIFLAKINPNCSKPFPFVCSHMLGDDCQTWKALVVLIEHWHVLKRPLLPLKTTALLYK